MAATAQEMQQKLAEGRLHEVAPNAERIRIQATRVTGRMPAQVRKELMTAVKANLLGHLKKDGLKPEIFFHPDHKHGAIERQNREALYAVKCIAGVMATPSEVRAGIEAMGGDPLEQALNGLA